MVLGTLLIKKQCISCTCVTRDSISFPKAVLFHTEVHKQTENGEGRREYNLKDEEGRRDLIMYPAKEH